MKKYIIKIFALLICLIGSSCSKWLTIQPETELLADEMFLSEEGFKDALTGVYINIAKIHQVESVNTGTFIEDLACQWTVVGQVSTTAMANRHEYSNLDRTITALFTDKYRCIADINIILGYVENGVLNKEKYSDTKGQLLALRSYLHFDLIRLWGPIPTEIKGNRYLPYVREATVLPYDYHYYEQYMEMLLADLTEAERLLLPKGTANTNPRYMRYYSAIALHSRVALWMGERKEATDYAKIIYENDAYTLGSRTDINNADYLFPTEHLFATSYETGQTAAFFTNLHVYEEELFGDVFTKSGSDIRKSFWKKFVYSPNAPNPIPKYTLTKFDFKQKDETSGETSTKNMVVFPLMRLAEIYLILIECLEIDEANVVYEKFCNARGMSYNVFDDGQRMNIVTQEYRREFFAEGQLFYFYKRNYFKNMPRCPRYCETGAYVLPLPLKETDITY